jgi:long-chain acyl-CoA synthetase
MTEAAEQAPGTSPRNVADLVQRAAERSPQHIAFREGATNGQPAAPAMTWSQVDTAVNAEAGRLVRLGLRPGDRVAIMLPTGIRFCVALFGAVRAGGIAVPVSTETPAIELTRLLKHCSPKFFVGDAPAGDGTDGVPEDVSALDPPALDVPSAPVVHGAPGGEDTAVLCYTSGTSGAPRGVMLSHRALLANVAQCAELRPAPVTATDRVLLAVPLFHAYGLGPGLLQATAAGATAVLMRRFTVESALEVCQQHRVTVLAGVPPMYRALAEVPAARLAEALSTVRLLTSGAAPLDPGVLAALRATTGLNVYEGYGLTETGPVLTSTLVSGYAKPGSVGRPLPGVELRLVDSDGKPMAAVVPAEGGTPFEDDLDEADTGTGVVSVRGANLFSGYWPDGAHGPDEDGWFRTGDVGYLDDDGDLHLVDRANDLIIVNGFNVYPHEVERALAELPGVAEAAAVGVPDERAGERVKAVLVLRAGAELTEDAVREHCAKRLAKFKVPAHVEFVDTLPHSATGKLRRATLRSADSV